jgi:branched-chain amino acid transport system substrate-binding protein
MQIIGILLSRSNYYETINFDLYEGLRSAIQEIGRDDMRIVTENIGFGADKQQCYRSAEKLILQDNASVVIAYIGHRTAQLLRPLFLASNRILIVLDAGSNLPQEWPKCPNIFYHSLHNSLGAWFAAKQAVEDGHLTGGMVTGYYDGGYLQTVGLFNGFQQAGGTICFNHATGYKKEDFTMQPLKNHLNQFPGSALLSLFSGDYVQWYFSEIKQLFGENNLPIYLPPFAFEETMLKNAIFPGNNAKGVVAWSKSIDNNENRVFMEAMESSGRIPNLFSVLSWESAQIAVKVLNLSIEHKNNIQQITSALQTFKFNGPRGTILFDPKTNTSFAPLYKASIIPDNHGMCEMELGSIIPDTFENFEKLTRQQLDNTTSAWFNSYACI